jgi:hypothetical protein
VAQVPRELHVIARASHYYAFQPDKLAEAVGIVKGWLAR